MDLQEQLEFIRQELAATGSGVVLDSGGEVGRRVLAAIMPSPTADVEDGHFYVEPMPDGSWSIHGRPDPVESIKVSGSASLSAVSVLAVELLLEARYDYGVRLFAYGEIDRLPVPPVVPRVRNLQISDVGERLVAQMVKGEKQPTNNPGFDVLAPDGTRIQVKSSQRNIESQRLSTVHFGTHSSWEDHDLLIQIEFSPYRYPLLARRIRSDDLRGIITEEMGGWSKDRNYQIEPVLATKCHGITAEAEDITIEVREAFGRLFTTSRQEPLIVRRGLAAGEMDTDSLDAGALLMHEIILGRTKEQSLLTGSEGFDEVWEKAQARYERYRSN